MLTLTMPQTITLPYAVFAEVLAHLHAIEQRNASTADGYAFALGQCNGQAKCARIALEVYGKAEVAK